LTALKAKSRFIFTPLAIPGVVAVQRQRVGDVRGGLSRVFCSDELAAAGWIWPVVQLNHTHTSRAGTVRGMHYQRAPHDEAKLVSCLRGRVWDVAIDIRAGSPTFLQSCVQELSAENLTALLIPPGCAHGFQALTDDVELLYLHSAGYAPDAEGGLRPTDPQLSIKWPLPISEVSSRDGGHPLLDRSFAGLGVPAGVYS
jgi:dTDP-4-dehydrorhamnose 3,5-epimerase